MEEEGPPRLEAICFTERLLSIIHPGCLQPVPTCWPPARRPLVPLHRGGGSPESQVSQEGEGTWSWRAVALESAWSSLMATFRMTTLRPPWCVLQVTCSKSHRGGGGVGLALRPQSQVSSPAPGIPTAPAAPQQRLFSLLAFFLPSTLPSHLFSSPHIHFPTLPILCPHAPGSSLCLPCLCEEHEWRM